MKLSSSERACIVARAKSYISKPFNYRRFNCVHFVREVYDYVGIILPPLPPYDYPPSDFHLSEEDLAVMPIGHIIFLKRKEEVTSRFWTHVALIYSHTEFIHCSRYIGNSVNIVSIKQMFAVYQPTQKPS